MAINPFTGGAADLADIPVELQPQLLQANRQQQMANMLLQQGMQGQPQGQMVSGHYVAPSWSQQLAPIATQALGLYGGYQADKAQTDLAAALRNKQADLMKQYQEAKTPQEKFAIGTSPYAPKALQAASWERIKPQKLGEGEVISEYDFGKGTYTPTAQGGEKMSPDVRTAAQMLGIRTPMTEWTPAQNQAVSNQVTANKRASATNVSVNTANKFAGGFAEKASGGAYDMYTAAMNAPQTIENSKRTIELVDKGAFTGPTANVALEAAKIFNVGGADNAEIIKNTELLAANRGKALVQSVKASGLAGSQGLTEGERRFLADAEGGRITLSGPTLKAMAGLEIKLAVENQKKWNKQASKMDKDILNVTGAGPVEVYTGLGTVDASNPLLAPKR